MTDSFLSQYLQDLIAIVVDPRKRLFVGYLLSALLIALVWYRLSQGAGLVTSIRRFFDRDVWLGESARADYKLLFLNQALLAGAAPALLGQLTVASAVYYALHDAGFTAAGLADALPKWAVMSGFTVTLFLIDDLSRYLLHRALHRVPMLWAFHSVHHSARTLTPFTVYRTHPVESLLFGLRSTLVHGVVIAVFTFAFGAAVDLVSVLGVSALIFVFNSAGSNLRHSHVALRYGDTVEQFLMSPAQHQLHHSRDPQHFDRNFGVVLALWDRLGGTHRPSKAGEIFHFGLTPEPEPGEQSAAQLYVGPFIAIGAMARRRLNALLHRISAPYRSPLNRRRV